MRLCGCSGRCLSWRVSRPANELPVSAFTNDPDLGLISISPNGDYLARSKRDGEFGTFQVVTYPGREVRGGALMHRLPDEPDHVLILRYENRFAEAHRMNVKNGHLRRIARSATRGGNLLANAEGRLEFSMGTNDEFVREVRHRPRGDDWRVLGTSRYGGEAWTPLIFGPRPELWYTLDITTVWIDNDDRPWAVRFDHHFPAYQYLNPAHSLAQQHAVLARMYPDDTMAITSSTRDYKVSVALISGDRQPGRFVLLNVDGRNVEHLASRYPNLPAEHLAPMAPVEFQVRDGATVYGYVTSAEKTPRPGPMVVVVHGGPHGIRDYWGFDPIVQLLANRGYHVLQVNFRGSGGYGHTYMSRGFGEWGGLMQDDVSDATRWAIKTGLADAERV